MAAFQKLNEYWPKNSADVEAQRNLSAHVQRGVKSTPARTSAGSTATKARQTTGTRVSGGGRVSGGRG